jgi:hypothetical protein
MERQALLVFVERKNGPEIIDLLRGQFFLYGSVPSGVNRESKKGKEES